MYYLLAYIMRFPLVKGWPNLDNSWRNVVYPSLMLCFSCKVLLDERWLLDEKWLREEDKTVGKIEYGMYFYGSFMENRHMKANLPKHQTR